MSELNLVLLGPPGSGKGTQGERLQEDLELPYYATGDILRAAVREGTELGRAAKDYMDRGDLVPDEVIVGMIGERIDSSEAADGFILDGFPRTAPQAQALATKLAELGRELTAVLLIDVSDEEVVRRLGGRRTCVENGHVFHVEFNPPKQEGVCDVDGSELVVRDDDKPEVIRHRLEQYHAKTAPLIEHYDSQSLLRQIDGAASPDAVADEIQRTLATLRLEAAREGTSVYKMIIRKTPEQVDKMAAAGEILVRCLHMLKAKARPGVTTKELDLAAEKLIRSQGAEPAFKGYRGFPGSICASPNSMVVHGIPGHYECKRGDVLSVDVGVIKDGWVADAAMTMPIGPIEAEARKLLDVTKTSLFAGVEQMQPGNKLGDVSAAIQRAVEIEGLSVIRTLVGHGIGREMHEDPQVPNFGTAGKGPVLEEGTVLAIEPMVNAGGPLVRMGDDGWAVYSQDGSLAAHFEFTVAVTADGPRILTPWHEES